MHTLQCWQITLDFYERGTMPHDGAGKTAGWRELHAENGPVHPPPVLRLSLTPSICRTHFLVFRRCLSQLTASSVPYPVRWDRRLRETSSARWTGLIHTWNHLCNYAHDKNCRATPLPQSNLAELENVMFHIFDFGKSFVSVSLHRRTAHNTT